MTIRTISALAAVLAALALPAVAQDVGLSLESSTSASSAVGAANDAPLDAQITTDNSYASLTAAINAGDSVDLSAVTDSAKVSVVKVSTLTGDAATEGAGLDAAVSAPWESRVSGAAAALVVTTTEVDATRTPVIVAAIRRRRVPGRRMPCRGGDSVVVRVVPCMLPPSRSSRAAEPLGQERATLRG